MIGIIMILRQVVRRHVLVCSLGGVDPVFLRFFASTL
jgi:hypothetical protein